MKVFKRLVATSRATQIMVLSMLTPFGKIGPQIDQIWAWLSRGHRWSPGVRNPLKSLVTGPNLLVNCYLEIKFHKIIRVNPPPPPLSEMYPNKARIFVSLLLPSKSVPLNYRIRDFNNPLLDLTFVLIGSSLLSIPCLGIHYLMDAVKQAVLR